MLLPTVLYTPSCVAPRKKTWGRLKTKEKKKVRGQIESCGNAHMIPLNVPDVP